MAKCHVRELLGVGRLPPEAHSVVSPSRGNCDRAGAISWIGLGFATAYGIVQKSAGAITVESEVSCGSVFRIYLPDCLEEA